MRRRKNSDDMSDLKPKANREMSSTFIRKTVILMMLIGLSISIAVPDSRAENETVRNLELPVMIIESGDAKDAADLVDGQLLVAVVVAHIIQSL